MRLNITIRLLFFFLGVYMLTSCLEGDEMNTPPGASSPIVQMTYNPNGGPLINSGLRYFGNSALTYPATDLVDTATFAVSIQGVLSLKKDVTVTLATPADALDDYYSNDSITYEMMPSAYYEFINTSAVINSGKGFAEFKVKFFPSKIDPTRNFMLPVTATNDANLPTSSNYGFIYFHAIGNPIAGSYTWDFTRYNNQAGTGTPAGGTFTGETINFAPVNPTTIKVPTGYYTQPNYLITFKDNGGVLSDFKAVIAPDEIVGAFTDNGVEVVTGPTITVSSDYTKFTVKYIVWNGSAYRNLTDVYTKQ